MFIIIGLFALLSKSSAFSLPSLSASHELYRTSPFIFSDILKRIDTIEITSVEKLDKSDVSFSIPFDNQELQCSVTNFPSSLQEPKDLPKLDFAPLKDRCIIYV